jgi:WD-repeat protein, putative
MPNLNTSKIFEGYRALGLVSGDKPFVINYAEKLEDLKIVVAVGKMFHSYSLNLRLIDTSKFNFVIILLNGRN